jgi:hypothetical protein
MHAPEPEGRGPGGGKGSPPMVPETWTYGVGVGGAPASAPSPVDVGPVKPVQPRFVPSASAESTAAHVRDEAKRRGMPATPP